MTMVTLVVTVQENESLNPFLSPLASSLLHIPLISSMTLSLVHSLLVLSLTLFPLILPLALSVCYVWQERVVVR